MAKPPSPALPDPPGPKIGPARPALLRTMNDGVALRLLLEHGQLSRSDMVRLIGVSKPTGSQMLARLESADLVRPVGVTKGRPGRAALLYEINPRAGFAAAMDVTPRRISAQVADLTGVVIGEFDLERPSRARGSGPGNAIKALNGALLDAGIDREDLSCVVLGAPGSYDAEADRIRYARQLSGWSGTGLLETLKAELRIPVSIENDVNLAAVAERRIGAARGCIDFFLFWVAEGVGGAFMLDDRLRRGVTGGAGEIAFLQPSGAAVVHNPVRGGTGALEQWTSGDELIELAHSCGLTGDDSATLVAMAQAANDPSSASFIDELARRFAIGLSSVIALIDPGAIVLAGSVLAAGGEPLRDRISYHLRDMAISHPRLLRSTVKGNAVLAGALQMALDDTRSQIFDNA